MLCVVIVVIVKIGKNAVRLYERLKNISWTPQRWCRGGIVILVPDVKFSGIKSKIAYSAGHIELLH